MPPYDAIPIDIADSRPLSRRRRCGEILRRPVGRRGGTQPSPNQPRLLDRAFARYALVVVFVVVAEAAAFLLLSVTGRFLAFPFYAVVVASAWFGTGPGCLAFVLAAGLAADFWTPTLFYWYLSTDELPSFIAFILFALMAFAWSRQRRRTQNALEATVQQRTADLLRTNAALQVEIAEREAAEEERKRTEQALREAEAELARTLRLATVAELAATIAHEVNQPLAAITANGGACLRSLAHQPPMLDNAREAAGCIVADGHRAGDVITRIRALFNKEQPQQLPLNVNDIIQHVLDLTRGAIERQRVVLRTGFATSPPMVMGDPVQLQQVMVNLVTNALEAMTGTAGRPRLLTVRSALDRDGSVVVTVEDSGSGFDREQASRIFDSFYTTKPAGIGVGLAISRSIIEAHGGSIWATPGARHGALLGFTLPLAPSGGG